MAMADDHIPDPSRLERRLKGGPARKKIRLSIATITPILGGSPSLRQIDDVDVIRGPSIRGHLRFWWRALYGHQWPDPAALAENEGALWGSAGGDRGGRSQVDIAVNIVTRSEPDDSMIKIGSAEGYALWPARPNRRQKSTAPRWKPGIAFQLTVHAPAPREIEVTHALRAWLLFGGYGSRTRRGLGSLRVIGDDQREWMPASISRGEWRRLFGDLSIFMYRSDEERSDMPSLAGATLCYGKPRGRCLEAWATALQWLRDFRQGSPADEGAPPHRYARTYGGLAYDREGREKRRPGPSNWPEPDKIRRLCDKIRRPSEGKKEWAHRPRDQHGDTPAWPRAGFGLPILGKFQREDRKTGAYYDTLRPPRHEPDDFALHWTSADGALHERLASPLILKAMPLQGERYAPIALWLFRGYPKDARVVLQQRDQPVRGSEAPFDRLRADDDGELLFRPLRGKSSLREAFVAWLKEENRAMELG